MDGKTFMTFQSFLKDSHVVAALREELILICSADPVAIGVLDSDNDVRLRVFQEHLEACPRCGHFIRDVTSAVLLRKENILEYHHALFANIPSGVVNAALKVTHCHDNALLYNCLSLLKTIKRLPFAFTDMPYLFLHHLFFAEVGNGIIANLFDIDSEIVRRKRDSCDIVHFRNANHVFQLLKEYALISLRKGEDIHIVSQRTGIDVKRLRGMSRNKL
jgi:hypothetical protein